MATEIVMPKLGLSMEEGTVVEWHKNEREQVEKGEAIVTISSDKAEIDVEAPDSGILSIVIPQDGVVPVSEVIGFVGAEGEAVQSSKKDVEQKGHQGPEQTDNQNNISPSARKLAKKEGINLSGIQGTGPGNRIMKEDVLQVMADMEKKKKASRNQPPQNKKIVASPVARKLAKKEGIDLSGVQGTGPKNRITKEDVLRAIADKKEGAPVSKQEPEMVAGENIRKVPVSGIRKVIAERMFQSLQQTAQLTLHTEVDATELVRLRQQIKEDIVQRMDVKLTYNDFIARATVLALENHPDLNAKWEEENIVQYGHVHLGIALSTDRGLMVPVVRNAHNKSLIQLSRDIKSLASAGKKGSLSVDDLTGSTFTITNLGSFGVDEFTPILNVPETGILGVGRLIEKPAIYQGEITVRTLMKLSLTFDHRVIDGVPAAEFLQELTSYIENPYRLISFDH
ncbi:2-oxo acid dehydrogenase subunit E2 [Melghirimyces algeriensis]|uniref:Dihydrolipoamide acetyltransferase component of pyruvate dehydrogenase complex n=1 Tax=Melghirimyces algeriensis TaxID=910412 RepID=A0A521BDP3_9BACL|nr:2-oxo acid dehydrogenase subunit E2 [Melghirimyces algeriensis]SMO45183.1 pyruvate dehydrogenase E2 component (dihydrolipoamide acetyltransferase) [Melghirimyces algeriensis]